MSAWTLLSILVLLLGLWLGLRLLLAVRDWRLAALPLAVVLQAARQAAGLFRQDLPGWRWWPEAPEVIELAVALLLALTISFMTSWLRSQRESPSAVERRDALARLLDASPTVIYSARPSGDYGPTYVSANVTTLFGYSPREFIEDPGFWAAHLHPEDAPRVCAERPRLFEEEHRAQEYRFRHRDGSYRWVHDDLRLVRDAEGKPELLVGSWIDITEGKDLEAQYRQAQKGEEVGKLAGGIAHDFNNLLNVIIGFSGLAREKVGSDDPLRRDLDLIAEAGAKASDLTRQLLAFSRQQAVKTRVLNLNRVVTEFESLVRRTIEASIDIELALDPSLGGVRADSGHIEQVLMNLVVNARDAMPRGGRLTLETTNVVLDAAYAQTHFPAKPGPYVLLAVTDTGDGMDEATRRRIFEPFFTTKGPGAGTGLGLSTVYGIVKQSGGYIWAYSEPGVGTTFKIYLPRVDEPSEAAPIEREEAEPGGSETLLVIEDEEAVRQFAARVLEAKGYRVLQARSADEAIRACESHDTPLDLVVTDLVLPGGGGSELVARLGQIKPGIRALYISGYPERAAVHQGQLTREADFLGKPFRAAALARKVREILDRPPA